MTSDDHFNFYHGIIPYFLTALVNSKIKLKLMQSNRNDIKSRLKTDQDGPDFSGMATRWADRKLKKRAHADLWSLISWINIKC